MGVVALIIMIVFCFLYILGIYNNANAKLESNDLFLSIVLLFGLIFSTFYIGSTL